MQVHATYIPDVLIIEPNVFGDTRGFFYESFNQKDFNEATGQRLNFVQDYHAPEHERCIAWNDPAIGIAGPSKKTAPTCATPRLSTSSTNYLITTSTSTSTTHGAAPKAPSTNTASVNYVLHQAALGTVPRSLQDPITTNDVNISGFLNMLTAARDAAVTSFVYAASSSTYGDHLGLSKVEDTIGKPLSPYAVTKYVNELYAEVFTRCYGFNTIWLRYFNVFGKRQDPNGAYAAVIPKWIAAMINNDDIFINGDGETSRDFCFIDNIVQANLLAATAASANKNEVYNGAVSDITTLNELVESLKTILGAHGRKFEKAVIYRDFREGDVRHSQVDIGKVIAQRGWAMFPSTAYGRGWKWQCCGT